MSAAKDRTQVEIALREATRFLIEEHAVDDEAETARDVVEACNDALRRLRKARMH